MSTARAKLFQNGGSQAVRLPKECRFPDEQTEVLVRREGRRVILEPVDQWPVSFGQAAASVSEGASTVTVTLQRSGNIDGTASVNYATTNGTAVAGTDYTATSGTVTFAVGQLTQTISVPILNDVATESDETFSVALSNPSGAELGGQTTTTITILDNDLTVLSG